LGGKLVRRFDLDVVLLLDDDSLLDESERGSEGRVNYSEKIRGVLRQAREIVLLIRLLVPPTPE
jgi:hypothetical protein